MEPERVEVEETSAAQDSNGKGQENGSSLPAPAGSVIVQDGQSIATAEKTQARSRSFADMLAEAGILSADQVSKAQEDARRDNISLSQLLVRDGLVLGSDLAAFTSLHLALPLVDLPSVELDPDVVGLLPEEVAMKYMVLALRSTETTLTVAMADPTNVQAIQDLTARTGLRIEPEVATDHDIEEHIDVAYKLVREKKRDDAPSDESGAGRLTADEFRNAKPAQFVELILGQAQHDGASDIHIEPTEKKLRIRFRIDGVLQETMSLPLALHPTLISRIKILSNMNIAERRKPQDGQLSFEGREGKVDVRTAIANTVYGEMGVLRLLDSGKLSSLGLDQLGMLPGQGLEKYREMLKLPYGMILVAGPTGSGKSTTLATSIMTLNRSELNVITMEDPVENELPDANQLQVHPEAGVTFAAILRSILRLDPDVILVGEIRDEETATLAIEAALTGHLVLSTVHANDSVSTLLRIKELGVPAYLIASAMIGVVAQRMVRKLCTSCAVMEERPLAEQGVYEEELGEKRESFLYGTGCNTCSQTGYRGRTGIYEVLELTDPLRQLFLNDAPRHELWNQTVADGTLPLKRDGMLKVKSGITTPYEIIRTAESG